MVQPYLDTWIGNEKAHMTDDTTVATVGLIAWDFLAFPNSPNITHLHIVWRLEIWWWRKTNPGRLLSTSCYKGWQDLAGGHAALKLIRSVPICMHICPFRDWSVSETFFLGTRTQYVSTSLYISLQDENLKRWMMVSWDSNESRFCLETVWDSEWGQYSKIASPLWSASSLTYSKTSVPWKPAFERFWNYIYISLQFFWT